MPALTYSIADFVPFTKIQSGDVNTKYNEIATLLNTTKLDDDNLQDQGITRADKLALSTTAHTLMLNDANKKVSEIALTNGQVLMGQTSAAPVPILLQGTEGTHNIRISRTTTTVTNDSVLITGLYAALSATNPGYVTMKSSADDGTYATFKVTANVTMDLTLCHWGLGTFGDYTADGGYLLSVYTVDEGGTLGWAVGPVPQQRLALAIDFETTQSDVVSVEKFYSATTVSETRPCLEIGWFTADFDDEGPDIWLINENSSGPHLGPRPALWEHFNPTVTTTTNATTTGAWRRIGEEIEVRTRTVFSSTNTQGLFNLSMPFGLVISNTKVSHITDSSNTHLTMVDSSTGAIYLGKLLYLDTTTFRGMVETASGTFVNGSSINTSTSSPIIIAAGDTIDITFSISVDQWDGDDL